MSNGQKYDEFGIPIKDVKSAKVDEFGILIKKKISVGTLIEPSTILEESASEFISPTEPYKWNPYYKEEKLVVPKPEIKPISTYQVTATQSIPEQKSKTQSDKDKVLEHFTEAFSQFPDAFIDKDTRIKLYREAYPKLKESGYNIGDFKEVRDEAERKWQDAFGLQEYQKRLNKNPDDLDSKYAVATYQTNLGKFVDAEKNYEDIILKNPKYSPAYTGLAYIYGTKGNNLLALSYMDDAIENNPDDASLWNNRAVYKQRVGDNPGAINDINMGLSKTDNKNLLAEMTLQRAKIYGKMGGIYDKSLADQYINQINQIGTDVNEEIDKEFFDEKYKQDYNAYLRLKKEAAGEDLKGRISEIEKANKERVAVGQEPLTVAEEMRGFEYSKGMSEALDEFLNPSKLGMVGLIINPVGFIAGVGAEGISAGLEEVKKGIEEVNPVKILKGGIESAIGTIMTVTPVGWAFTGATTALGELPYGEYASSILMQPISSAMKAIRPDIEPGEIAGLGDIMAQGILFHKVNQKLSGAKEVAKKIEEKKPLTADEIQTYQKAVENLSEKELGNVLEEVAKPFTTKELSEETISIRKQILSERRPDLKEFIDKADIPELTADLQKRGIPPTTSALEKYFDKVKIGEIKIDEKPIEAKTVQELVEAKMPEKVTEAKEPIVELKAEEIIPKVTEEAKPTISPEPKVEPPQKRELLAENIEARQEPIKEIPEGIKGETKFSAEVSEPFIYKLIEADELQPSHLSSGERNPKHHIAGAQPKERSDQASKLAQDKIAENPNFGEVGESPNAYFGTPIINARGEVIQGNNRSIGLKKHYERGKTKYKEDLTANAEKFGLTKEQVQGMKNPVLVREVKVGDTKAVELGQYDVKDIETGGKQRIDPITTSRKIKPEDKSKLASLVFSGEYTTVKDAIRSNANKVKEVVKGYLNPAQMKNAFTEEGFSAKGMDDIQAVIDNFLFEEGKSYLPELFEGLPSNIQKGLQKSLPNILSVERGESLLPEIQNAIQAIYEFNNSNLSKFREWANTADMFKGATPKDVFSEIELKLAQKLLDAKKQVEIKHIFAEYEGLIKGKEATLLEKKTPGLSKSEAIQKQFNVRYQEAISERYAPPSGEARAMGVIPEPAKKPTPTPTTTENAREQLKSSAKELGDKFKDLFKDELGIIYDPKRDAQRLYDFHVALVKTARDAIKLGVATAKDFADSIGRKLDKFTERAWEDAQKQEIGEFPIIKTPKYFEKTFTLEKGKEVRGFAESVKEAKPEMIEEINKNPELQYEKQNLKEVKEGLANMTDEQKLEKMNELGKFASIESGNNFGVLAGIDLMNKYIAEGKDPTPILEQLSKAGTTMGQLIRQFAELKGSTPESVLMVFEKELAKKDRTLTEGQKDILKELSKADIEARAKYNEQKKKTESEYTEDNMKELERLKKEAEKKYKTLAKYMMDITPKGFWETSGIMLQGNLLTPISIITNPFSNALLIPLRIAEKALVAPIDALYSYITGKPRTVTMEGVVAGLKGFGMGTAEAGKQIWTGLDVSDLKKAEVQRGFRPLRSLVQAWTGKDMPLNAKGKIPIGDRAMKVYEGILGAPPEIMFRLLSLGDKPFLRMAEQSSLYRIAKSKGLKGKEFEKFMRFPDKKSYEEMQKAGQEATFQEESKVASMVSSGMNQLAKVPFVGGAFKFLAKTQMPYIKTPTNIISQTLDYAVPPISLAKALYYASKKNRREALINLGKFGVGSMMIYGADYLYDNDIISPSPDEEQKQKALKYDVFPPNSVNLSALERLQKGESTEPREGDEFISYSKMGVLGAIINMRANLGEKGWQEGKDGRDEDAMGYVHSMVASFPDLAHYSLEQSFLQGTANLLDAIKDKEWDKWIANTFNAVSSIPLPNTLSALNRVDREYIPSLMGDNIEERLSNVIKNKTFQADGLPVKINLWGEKIKQTPEGSNAWLYQMFDVTKMQEINDNKLSKTIYDLWRKTQDADVIPTIPDRNITIGDNSIRLTQKQYQELLEEVGKERKEDVDKLIEEDFFKLFDDEQKIKSLKKHYDQERETAFYRFKKELILTKEQEGGLGENLLEFKRKLKKRKK